MIVEKTKSLGYIPAFDGVRALAIGLVMLAHANFQLFENGGIGVPVFFALSGFLITTLLLEEFERSNTLSFGAFYIRRSLRLFPVLYCVLIAVFIYAYRYNYESLSIIKDEIIFAGAYGYNLGEFWNIKPFVLYHAWSLGVEEQFYLIWPILLFLGLRYSTLHKVLIGLIFFYLLLWSVTFLVASNGLTFKILKTVFSDSIFLGCIVAILRWKGLINFKIPWFIGALSAVLIIVIGALPHKTWHSFNPNSLGGVLSISLILSLLNNEINFFSYLFNNKVAVFVGKISYGLYLWHLPIFKIFAFHSSLPAKVSFIGKFVISFIVAIISWYVLEKRITKVGHQLSKKILNRNDRNNSKGLNLTN